VAEAWIVSTFPVVQWQPMRKTLQYSKVRQVEYRLDHWELEQAVRAFVIKSPNFDKAPGGAIHEDIDVDFAEDDDGRTSAVFTIRYKYPDKPEPAAG
jgi:hypothetical protein